MINAIEFYVLVICIALIAMNVIIAIRYDKYLKQHQNKLNFFQLARKFAEDHSVAGRIFLYSAYSVLSAIPIMFLLVVLKSFNIN